jgi:hypothetical protein
MPFRRARHRRTTPLPTQAATGTTLPLAPVPRSRFRWLVIGGVALSAVIGRPGRASQAGDAHTYLALPRTRARTVAQIDHRPDNNAGFAKFADLTNQALLKSGMPKS